METISKKMHAIPTNQFTLFLKYFPSNPLELSAEAFLLLQSCETTMIHFLLLCLFMLCFILKQFLSKPKPIYLVDFSCLKPQSCYRAPFSKFLKNASKIDAFDSESIAFMAKILTSSGMSEETCLPPALHYIPPKTHQQESIKEAELVLFPIMDDLLAKTKLSPLDIDILIVNCSGFCPSPSLSSIVVNKYSMRSDIKSYNISGMGCSASALCIDLVHNLLKVHHNCNAVVLSTEILSNGWYAGNERSKLLINCLFRMGSAAILLTNRTEARKSSKYRLIRTLRTQRAFDEKAYFSAFREEDANGNVGVTFKKDFLQAVRETLRGNITILGSEILPFSEKLWYGVSVMKKRFINKAEGIHAPNFKNVIQHFCLPSSGRPLIREIGKGLKLYDRDMEPALMTLHRFGNQSSSSLWYELAYLEAKERVQKGNKIWLLGIGTGHKCTSAILECIRPITGQSNKSPWDDCIHQYPIAVEN